jgi:hypothetical protein
MCCTVLLVSSEIDVYSSADEDYNFLNMTSVDWYIVTNVSEELFVPSSRSK